MKRWISGCPGLDEGGGQPPGHQVSFRGEEKALRATVPRLHSPVLKALGSTGTLRRTVHKFYLSKAVTQK